MKAAENPLEKYYTIGEVSKICNISTKALRHYEQIGVIVPDFVSPETGYRYYTRATLLLVPIVKYYKQMGFKLEEMQSLVSGKSHYYMEHAFHKKMEELTEREQEIARCRISVSDWHDMLDEARVVKMNQISQPSTKYLPAVTYCFREQPFHYDYFESIINIDWEDYRQEMKAPITGPVILCFASYQEKMQGLSTTARVMQKPIYPYDEKLALISFPSRLVISAYHIGNLNSVDQTYEKLVAWAKENKYQCSGESYERYLVDYWTTQNCDEFITEVILPVDCNGARK